MSRYALLIDYDYCCGCHTCEVACQKEHDLAVGQWGIKIAQNGPFTITGTKKVIYDFVPIPTDLCDLCVKRTTKGKLPTCVHHCQTNCMKYGTVEELSRDLEDKPRQALFAPL